MDQQRYGFFEFVPTEPIDPEGIVALVDAACASCASLHTQIEQLKRVPFTMATISQTGSQKPNVTSDGVKWRT